MHDEDSLEFIRPYLLPNEDVEFVCTTQRGSIVLSTRRFVVLRKEKRDEYCIEKVIPYDCIVSIDQKKRDSFEISGITLDQYGQLTGDVSSFIVRAFRNAQEEFQSEMCCCANIVEKIRNSIGEVSHHDYSYLEYMPVSLTENAILDLNTILRDLPVHDTLVHEAEEFLGSEPFLLEESLRTGNDRENGVLFAAGAKGYFWIQGQKYGRFMSNVLVDTVEWKNIRCFAHQWDSDDATIFATYSLTEDGRELMTRYQWNPPIDEDTLQFPWLLQKLNGPWILADICYKHFGQQLPASWNVKQSDQYTQRYYH